MRSGVRLGIDVGTVRVGVARSDLHGMLATPVETVTRGDGDVTAILAIASELEAIELIVGLPLSLSGARTRSTDDAAEFAARLAVGGRPVRLVDERLSTVSAQQSLHAAGRDTKGSRKVIDQVAATIILQHALDLERSSGTAPGELVVSTQGP
ncbi:Holliday junction resolvase RuvX [Cryobacterium sp. BB736]|uniref:Holliday junction resolvase RuvX n=1 Tax=Cryobacterium sp. BB736 TaxID=2746963 RepID=UPI001876F6DF|nr:Holliday junction resolvase RuvX [Cryobacterium sp. BB736]